MSSQAKPRIVGLVSPLLGRHQPNGASSFSNGGEALSRHRVSISDITAPSRRRAATMACNNVDPNWPCQRAGLETGSALGSAHGKTQSTVLLSARELRD